MSKRIRIHYHRPGKGTIVYHEHLVLDREDVKVTLLRKWEEREEGEVREVKEDGRIILGAGAPIVWFVFPHAWRDIGRFHLADGTFTGWYTNFCLPTRIDGDDWHCDDLLLDHWLPVDGEPAWLDEDELADGVARGLIDAATERRIIEERAAVDRQLAAGTWPPAIAREIDLAAALEAVGE